MSRIDPETEAGYCIEQIRQRVPPGAPVSRYGGVAAYPRRGGVPSGEPLMRDPSLPHQIVLERPKSGAGVAVSCNCRWHPGRGGGWYEPLEVRARWAAGEALRVWREHMAGVGDE